MQGLRYQVQGLGFVHGVLGSCGKTLSRGRAGQLWGPVRMDWSGRLESGGWVGGWVKGPGGEAEA